jgi:hypothetical protein
LIRKGYLVFVMGGSGGAHAINVAMKVAASFKDIPGLQILPRPVKRCGRGRGWIP